MKKFLPIIFFLCVFLYLVYDVKNDPDFQTHDLLVKAIKSGDLSTVKTIIEKDKKFVNFKVGFSTLHEAAMYCQEDIIDYLIRNGADVNARCGNRNFTAITVAASNCDNNRIIDIFLKNGAIVDSKDDDSATPLMAAAEHGNTETIKALLANGASINAKSRVYGTALDYAYEKHQYKAAKLLEQYGARRKRK